MLTGVRSLEHQTVFSALTLKSLPSWATAHVFLVMLVVQQNNDNCYQLGKPCQFSREVIPSSAYFELWFAFYEQIE